MSFLETFPNEFRSKIRTIPKVTNTKEVILLDKETGEYEQILHENKKQIIVDRDTFVKIFKNLLKISKVSLNMSKLSLRLIFWIIENLPKESISIVLNPKLLNEDLDNKSLSNMYKAINELQEIGILKQKKSYLYEVNPSLLFNGNRVKFVKSIITQYTREDGWKVTEYQKIEAERNK